MPEYRQHIPAAELAEGEPKDGGLTFWEAAEQWCELAADWWKNDPVGDRQARLEERFKSRWYAGDFIAYGYPLHDLHAVRRTLVSSELCERLLFDLRGGARDDLVLKPRDDGPIDVRKRNDGFGIRRFLMVFFYRAPRKYADKKAAVIAAMRDHEAQLEPMNKTARVRFLAGVADCSVARVWQILAEQSPVRNAPRRSKSSKL